MLSTRKEFKVGAWIDQARNLGNNKAEKDLYEWNARVQITTWGNRTAADEGGLRDYAHREWSGILKDLYYKRWKIYLDNVSKELQGISVDQIDYYAIEKNWAEQTNAYNSENKPDLIETAKNIFNIIF